MPAGSPGSLPGARVLLRPGLGHHDFESQTARISPPAATTLGVPTTGAIPVMTVWMSSAVTPLSAAAPALVTQEPGGASTAIGAAMSANVSRTGVRRSWSPLGCCGTRLSAQVGYPNSTALLPAGGYPPGWGELHILDDKRLMASGKHVGKLLRG